MTIGSSDGLGLSFVTVQKLELLGALRSNRETHKATFTQAHKGYREAVVRELESMLADAKEGKSFRKLVSLTEPGDHTKDYDRIIRMLEMSVKDEVHVSEHEFSQYVLDDWGWKAQFVNETRAYRGER